MPDLDLELRPSGKYDFVVEGGSLRTTTSVKPAVLRLLLQGTWVGDDGERAGQSLGDVKLSTTQTADQIQRIVETRLSVLLKSGQLTKVNVLEVKREGDRAFLFVEIQEPGQQPETVQVPLTA